MKIQIVYDYRNKTKVLEVDNKFKTILVAWDENCMSLWQELANELHQIIRSEINDNRYSVYDMNSKKLMYSW